MSRPKSAAVTRDRRYGPLMAKRSEGRKVKDINIDIADILGQKYRYRIDIGKGDIGPPLIRIHQQKRTETQTMN